jgi:hypothetical protein
MMLYGELPTSPVVFAACDSKYFMDHAGPFIYSADKHKFDVHINVVNPTDEVLSYAALLSSTVSSRVTFTFNDEDVSRFQGDALRAYYACLRFLIAPTILRSCQKLLILDIDCLIMNEFKFPDKPVGFYPRESLPGTVGWEAEGTKVAAGAVYFDETAYDVAAGVASEITQLPLQWFNDQIALSKTFDRVQVVHKEAFRVQGSDVFHHFDESFMDWEFKSGTTIWTGKGPRKYDNVDYLAAKKEYDKLELHLHAIDNVILKPRLDIMFKRNGLTVANSVNEPIREHWKNFVDKLENDVHALVVEAPRWFFNNTICDQVPNVPIYVPHTEKHLFHGTDNCRYYMQTVFPWLFTIDPIGWGGGSKYKYTFDPNGDYPESNAFELMQDYVKKGGTKFKHLQQSRDISELDAESFVLVPLQLPHDETIKYHSNVDVPTMVRSLCEWADNGGMTVVFKGHPVNMGSMVPLMEIIEQYDNVRFVTDYNINDLFEKSCAVYVINSGTGQEAMLHEKPVVCFGRCDYEAAVIQGDIFDPEGTWKQVLGDDFEERTRVYRQWYKWFVNSVTYDTR